jgi:hypothetical protein
MQQQVPNKDRSAHANSLAQPPPEVVWHFVSLHPTAAAPEPLQSAATLPLARAHEVGQQC